MYNILVCDDEKDIVNALTIYLSAEGYQVFSAENGQAALNILQQEDIHLVLMDIMMPIMDGITATVELRKTFNIPVILLTAKSEDADKILGLNIGADDYITKPFQPMELLARVKSQLRRYILLGSMTNMDKNSKDSHLLTVGSISLDDRGKRVTVDGEHVNLTPKEFEILKYLMLHPGEVFSPKELYSQIWQEAIDGAENAVAVHIRHLREKIEIDPANPRYIIAIWGHGYKMNEQY